MDLQDLGKVASTSLQVGVSFVAGRLRFFLDFWKTLTFDRFILEIIEGVKIPFDSFPAQLWQPREINCSVEEKTCIDAEIATYLTKGIIQTASHSYGEFVSQIFPRRKKSGGTRIIINLKDLNLKIKYEHFKMETLNAVLFLMEANCFMASIDLEDAYYSVNVNDAFRKFLRFSWNSQLYEFTCLPNGLSCAPRMFTKILKPIYEKLRKQGHVSVYYLDDSWLMGTSFEECSANVRDTAGLLTAAGFKINQKKSVPVPSQQVSFLGFCLDSVSMQISLPQEKIDTVLALCTELLQGNSFKIRFLAKFIGVLVSCLPAVKNAELYYRFLELNKLVALRTWKGDFDGITTLNKDAVTEVIWWRNNVHIAKDIITSPPDLLIATDASLLGWGAVYNRQCSGGQWTAEEAKLHINILELKAILFGLKSFFPGVRDKHIRIQSDNSTAVAYVNNKGGVKSIDCHRQAKAIWEWALPRNINLSAEHLPGSDNTMADKASRIFDENTEWALDSTVYHKIQAHFTKFDIDLFASRLNAKNNIYSSWKPDPNAAFVDAFTSNWNDYTFYAFPPFSIVMKTLTKIRTDVATGVLICPIWPTQAWFPKVMQMLIGPPLILPLNILHLPFNSHAKHRKDKTLHLMACHLSGNISLTEGFQATLSTSCVLPGGDDRLSNMQCILKSGYISAIKGKLIPYRLLK